MVLLVAVFALAKILHVKGRALEEVCEAVKEIDLIIIDVL